MSTYQATPDAEERSQSPRLNRIITAAPSVASESTPLVSSRRDIERDEDEPNITTTRRQIQEASTTLRQHISGKEVPLFV